MNLSPYDESINTIYCNSRRFVLIKMLLLSFFSFECQPFHTDSRHHNVWTPKAVANKDVAKEDDQGHCIWYGTCTDCDYSYNYAYEGEAMALEEYEEESLRTVCPELFDLYGK